MTDPREEGPFQAEDGLDAGAPPEPPDGAADASIRPDESDRPAPAEPSEATAEAAEPLGEPAAPAPPAARDAPPALRREAEAILEQGIQRFEGQDLEGAHDLFERAHRRAANDPRVMSWYGVTLVLVEKNSNLGMLYCDQALRLSGPSPDLLLNQARAYLALHQRERAYRAVHRGISQWPDHPALRLAQDAMGWRRRPVLPCFSRSSALNRWLGKLRHRWHNYRSPPPLLSPVTLGVLPPARSEPRSE
jgi:tetratricopeptide (TPR) repeat protein